MNPDTLAPPLLIQDEAPLREMTTELQSHAHIAVDTESNSLYAYKEQVCLIQFSVPGKDYLVDPLATPDLKPLSKIFSDPSSEKIFHGAEYDVMCLKRDFGFTFKHLFDTRLAWRTLGREHSGLSKILADEFDVQIDKRFQRADWGKRPLTDELLNYARLDTHYLLALRNRLVEALELAGCLEEAREACEYITTVDAHENGFDPHGFWRIRNVRDLEGKQLSVLRELYHYRDTQASRLNRPQFKIIGDQTLLAIAQDSPANLDALSELPGMTRGQMRRYGEGLLRAIQRGLDTSPPRKPALKPIDEAVQSRYEALHKWRKDLAKKRGVESDIIMPRELLWDIARSAPKDQKRIKKIMGPMQWRFQKYGAEILTILWG
jgi:ribonuclease D